MAAKGICLICGKPSEEGLRLRGHLVCTECEASIVGTPSTDGRYHEFVGKLKPIWEDVISVARQEV